MFVCQHAPSRRTYMLKLGPIHLTAIFYQHAGTHIQLAIGIGATARMPGFELTAGISHWSRKARGGRHGPR